MAAIVKVCSGIFLVSIAVNLSSCHATSENNGAQTQIVGGTTVSAGSDQNKQIAAATIALRTLTKRLPDGTFNSKQGCTATIISPTTAVTAAHCFETSNLALDMFDETLFAVFGLDSTKATLDSMRRVTAVATYKMSNNQDVHALFKSGGSSINDIALIKFEEGLPSGFGPVQLAQAGTTFPSGTEFLRVAVSYEIVT